MTLWRAAVQHGAVHLYCEAVSSRLVSRKTKPVYFGVTLSGLGTNNGTGDFGTGKTQTEYDWAR